ncbi:MAG: hypothetical protein H0W46_04855 [Acidimicrobiia bacterium]|nr:hypothetical protein [Acidimicrobiia bacterium]
MPPLRRRAVATKMAPHSNAEGGMMFVQVMEGRVADEGGLRRQFDRWMTELRPGAKGFLGTTAGVTADGTAVMFARFDSAADAATNSSRPEQGEWWSETQGCFDGEVSITDSDDVETFLAGGSDDARFVQIMKGHGVARDRLRALDEQFEPHATSWRPDLLGGIRVWTDADSYVEVAYFTNEEEARKGESKPPPAELSAQMSEFQSVMANVDFVDLRDPWLY